MGTVIGILVVLALILIIGAIANNNQKAKKLRSANRPPVRPRPPDPPGMSFRIERRTEPYSPPRPGSARPDQARRQPGPGLGSPTVTVNTAGWCELYGQRTAECTCERCRNARKGASR